MSDTHRPDPLHGITLQAMVEHLVQRYGWPGLATRIRIRCFASDPSVGSSLKFLRRTPWARQKVESLYLHSAAHPLKADSLKADSLKADSLKADPLKQTGVDAGLALRYAAPIDPSPGGTPAVEATPETDTNPLDP